MADDNHDDNHSVATIVLKGDREMRSNVYRFPPSPQGQYGEWRPRIIMALAYLALGYVFRGLDPSGLTLLGIMGLLYWAFIRQRRLDVPFFIRFHLLQGLLLMLFLTLAFGLLSSLWQWVSALLLLFSLDDVSALWLNVLAVGILPYVPWAVLGLSLFVAILTLQGRLYRLPWVGNIADSLA
ncbi:MAG: hypothetical protein SFZ03_04575 [Candidatus Melainabacteria bacterium]|nr:hypothetical protein [Candidatus Melainabacteria bacterium]